MFSKTKGEKRRQNVNQAMKTTNVSSCVNIELVFYGFLFTWAIVHYNIQSEWDATRNSCTKIKE